MSFPHVKCGNLKIRLTNIDENAILLVDKQSKFKGGIAMNGIIVTVILSYLVLSVVMNHFVRIYKYLSQKGQ